jgi:hypothetical protein
MCPVHLDREKTTNLSQATNKLNNRARDFLPVQVYWTHLLALLLSVLVACDRFVVFFRSRCTGHILLTEQEDVSSTPGPGENHQSVTSH